MHSDESIVRTLEPHTSLSGAPVVYIRSYSWGIHRKPETEAGYTTYYYSDGTSLTVLRGNHKDGFPQNAKTNDKQSTEQ